MNRRAKGIGSLLLVMAAIGSALFWQSAGGPFYRGRRTADWVDLALRESSRGEAFEAVLQIGPPAVPFIARKGLRNKYHNLYYLSDDYVAGLVQHQPWLWRWLSKLPWINYNGCAAKHDQARWLLFCIGTNAQAAIPDVIDCLEHCRGLHFVGAVELMDTLGEISGTNCAAIPYLTKRARGNGSLCLRAAAMAYNIDGQTNLMVETCQRLARKDPGQLLSGQELFWYRADHELNLHLVPLLEELYTNPPTGTGYRESAMFELESRSNDATAAIARLLARQTNPPVQVK
ncbi:MAG: hypothetical protein NT154_33415 [Verrucomicrobia bacterium]|nr:hypothetical protein [Verrucomicrobiota bacterium]